MAFSESRISAKSPHLPQKLIAVSSIIILVSLFCLPTAFSQIPSSELFSLELNTPSETGLDVIFVPEDYTVDELGKFRETVDMYYQSLLSSVPFSEFRDWINVWRIDTTEDFESQRSPTMDRLLTVNVTKVMQCVTSLGDFDLGHNYPDDLVIVLVNSSTYGGSGGSDVVVSYTGTYGKEVMMHELGHSFGHFGDEYVLYDQDFPAGQAIPFPNIDWTGSKWQDIPGTGAYLGAWYRNLVRPTDRGCIMRTVSNFGFCPVCVRALLAILGNYTPAFYYVRVVSTIGSGEIYVNGTLYAGKDIAFASGDVANVTAVPSPGWTFKEWVTFFTPSTGNPIYFVMTENKSVSAVFESLDTVAPTGSISINDGELYTSSISVLLSLTYSDSDSGVSQVRYSNDGTWDTENWESPSPTRTWTLTPGDGTKTVTYQIKDNAGLEATYSDSITLDATKPEANAGQNQTVEPGTTVNFTAVDSIDNMGLAGYAWSFGDGATGSGVTATHVYSSPGTYTVILTVEDLAGNQDTVSVFVTVQYVIPEVPSTVILLALLTISSAVSVAARKKVTEPTA